MNNNNNAQTQDVKERRKSVNDRTHAHQASLWQRGSLLLASTQLGDVLSAYHHSADFNQTRATYIAVRLKLMAYVFAFSVPLMSIFDYLVLHEDKFLPMFLMRTLLSLMLIGLGYFSTKRCLKWVIRGLLPLAFLLPSLFYAGCMLVLSSEPPSESLVGFTMMPMLIVAMMGLFPLTLVNGCVIIALVLAPSIAAEYYFGDIHSLEALNKLWLFLMFAGISLWLQVGQLLMLLKLYRESTLDPLTGLINRRVLVRRLDHEKLQVSRDGYTFSLLMFDLDRFKRINDTYGHQAGDKVLSHIAKLLKTQLRRNDIIARFGGEEFVAVLPGLGRSQAIMVADRIRQAINQQLINLEEDVDIQVSSSIGVCEYEPWEEIEQTLRRADDALYRAKTTGRDRVVSLDSEEHQALTLETATASEQIA